MQKVPCWSAIVVVHDHTRPPSLHDVACLMVKHSSHPLHQRRGRKLGMKESKAQPKAVSELLGREIGSVEPARHGSDPCARLSRTLQLAGCMPAHSPLSPVLTSPFTQTF
jgi:hypothetical protein